MTPYGFESINNYSTKIFVVNNSTEFETYDSENSVINVRPVINLKADVSFTGDGSFDNPYVIVTN